jgi:hypothetical protein
MHKVARIVFVFGWLLAVALPAAVMATDDISVLMPELLTLPAPSWVKPGQSLTYHTGAASVPGSAGYFWQNEDEKKDPWVGRGQHDRGKTYSRRGQTGSGGEGYSQADIVALEGNTVAVSLRTWAKHLGHLVPKTDLGAANFGGAGPAGCTGNWWVNASVLKTAVAKYGRHDRPASVRDVRVFATPCNASNRTFETIRFEVASNGGHSGRNYDVHTGILVYNDTSATSREKANTWSGDSSALSFSELEGARQISVPWAGAEPPPWAATVRRLVFEGTYIMATPGTALFPRPYRATMDVTRRGRTWFQYRAYIENGGIGGLPPVTSQYELVSGIAQIGGLWVPPGAGRGLPVGTVLDRNPTLGTTVTVTQNSGNTLTITETGPEHTTKWTYDTATGTLQILRQEIRPFNIKVEMRNKWMG